MYYFIYKMHKSLKQSSNSYIEMKTFNYCFEIGILRNSSQKVGFIISIYFFAHV